MGTQTTKNGYITHTVLASTLMRVPLDPNHTALLLDPPGWSSMSIAHTGNGWVHPADNHASAAPEQDGREQSLAFYDPTCPNLLSQAALKVYGHASTDTYNKFAFVVKSCKEPFAKQPANTDAGSRHGQPAEADFL